MRISASYLSASTDNGGPERLNARGQRHCPDVLAEAGVFTDVNISVLADRLIPCEWQAVDFNQT
jgi:hypothetical protein